MKHVQWLDPITDTAWRSLIRRCRGSIFHSPPWLSTLAQTYDFDVTAAVVVDDGGDVIAGLPMCRIEDIHGERLVALAFSDYCDPLANTQEDWDLLGNAIVQANKPFTLRCVNNDYPSLDPRFVEFKHAKWHGLDLAPEIEQHWQRIDGSMRRAINKAMRSKLEIRMGAELEDLRSFFQLHLAVRKHKYRMLAQPYSFFENIQRNFMDKGRGAFMMAEINGAVVASSLFLQWEDTLYYKFNASAADQLEVRPNDLIIWKAIEYAKEHGLTSLDFGLSDWDQDGLVRYKRKFASTEKTISFLRWSPRSVSEQESQIRQLLGNLTTVLTEPAVPDTITEASANLLYRYFA